MAILLSEETGDIKPSCLLIIGFLVLLIFKI